MLFGITYPKRKIKPNTSKFEGNGEVYNKMRLSDFEKLKKLRFESEVLADRIKELEAIIEYSATKYSDMPKSHDIQDKKSEQIVKLLMLKDRYIKLVFMAETRIDKIMQKIKMLPEAQYKVMYYRHVKNLSWSKVAGKTNYHIRTCFKLEKKAIKQLNLKELGNDRA